MLEQAAEFKAAEDRLLSALAKPAAVAGLSPPPERDPPVWKRAPASHSPAWMTPAWLTQENRPREAREAPPAAAAAVSASPEALAFQARLSVLDAAVFEQRMALAESERNALARERHELQAQLRRMEAERRRAQEDMQSQFAQQLATLAQTFDKVGQAVTRAAAPDRQERARRRAAYEERIRTELLPLADGSAPNAGSASAPRHPPAGRARALPGLPTHAERWDCVFSCGEDGDSDALADGGPAERVWQALRAERPDARLYPEDSAGGPGGPADFLAALVAARVFVPVCAWYATGSDGEKGGGSVGRLSRLDPLGDDGDQVRGAGGARGRRPP